MISMLLATRIANACGFPFLFLGKFRDIEINYILLVTIENAWSHPLKTIIVLAEKQLICALSIDWAKKKTSRLINIVDYGDKLKTFVQKHAEFPSAEDVLDGTSLRLLLLEQANYREISVHNPELSIEPSLSLVANFEKMWRYIQESSVEGANIVHPEISLEDVEPDNSLFRYLELAKLFELSGLFGQDVTPHDIEFILEIKYKLTSYIFVKTSRWFRGTQFKWGKLEKFIIDLGMPDIHLATLILESPPSLTTGIIELGFYYEGKYKRLFNKHPILQDEKTSLNLALRPLMQKLDEAFA